MARGKIIFYSTSEGHGLVVSAGQQRRFEIGDWIGTEAPRLNGVVELTEGEGGLRLAPVDDTVLLKENFRKTSDSLRAASTPFAQSVVDRAGRNSLIAYAIFALGTFFPVFAVLPFMTGSLAWLLRDHGDSFWVWLSCLSIGLPLVWRNRQAWWAWTMPLLTVLIGLDQVFPLYWDTGLRNPLQYLFLLRLGAFLTLLSAAYLAILAVRNYLLDR